VPHVFQQELSAQKTPIICNVIPAFQSMEIIWKEHLQYNPDISDIVQAGLDKLSGYAEQLDLVPAYVLSLSKCHTHISKLYALTFEVLNPKLKMSWFSENEPKKVQCVKTLYLA
ncbi:hypothetical protein BDQ17DRAFT_1241803, partial [Cyathus striatus]